MKRFFTTASMPALWALLFGLFVTACDTPQDAYDWEQVRVFNDSSRKIMLQVYTDSWDTEAGVSASDLALYVIAPKGAEGDFAQLMYYPQTAGGHFVPQKVLVVDAETRQLLLRLTTGEFYAALDPQPPVVETTDWDSVVTTYSFDLRLTDDFLSAQGN